MDLAETFGYNFSTNYCKELTKHLDHCRPNKNKFLKLQQLVKSHMDKYFKRDFKKNKTHLSVANAGRVIWVLTEDVAITTVALQVSVKRHKNSV